MNSDLMCIHSQQNSIWLVSRVHQKIEFGNNKVFQHGKSKQLKSFLSMNLCISRHWRRLLCSQGMTVQPSPTLHCIFEVRSEIHALKFGLITARYCFPSNVLTFRDIWNQRAMYPIQQSNTGLCGLIWWKPLNW